MPGRRAGSPITVYAFAHLVILFIYGRNASGRMAQSVQISIKDDVLSRRTFCFQNDLSVGPVVPFVVFIPRGIFSFVRFVVGCFVVGCFVIGCFVIGCFVIGCFVVGCFVVGCFVIL